MRMAPGSPRPVLFTSLKTLSMKHLLHLCAVLLVFGSCDPARSIDFSLFPGPQSIHAPVLFDNVTSTHLPFQALGGASMDARAADVDNDGDLDIVIACEFCRNILLINDGSGRFTDESHLRFPHTTRDSEDIGIADFNGDGWLDVVFVSEDDQLNELFLNTGNGFFVDASGRIPVAGISNAVLVHDFNLDGFPDITIGNEGRIALLINDGNANFSDEAPSRMPNLAGVTQDLVLGDIDDDGDLDLLVCNEGQDWLFINDGIGFFTDESFRLQHEEGPERTREGDFGDINGDGRLDIFFANENYSGGSSTPRLNRLLLNDGNGYFKDITGVAVRADNDDSFDGKFIDLDGDGDLDIFTGNCMIFGSQAPVPYGIYLNNGAGFFTRLESGILPPNTLGCGFAVVHADFNGDGIKDLFIANRNKTDQLLFGRRPGDE